MIEHEDQNKNDISFKKTLVVFIDILGFSERFFLPNEKKACVNLLREFAQYNRSGFDIFGETVRYITPTIRCFSDSVIIFTPINYPHDSPSVDIYAPWMSLLAAINAFTRMALIKKFLIRGAVACGEMLNDDIITAGTAYIEAVRHEKIALYPRVILTPSALDEIFSSSYHLFGWNKAQRCKEFSLSVGEDNLYYFDWCTFPYRETPSFNEISESISWVEDELQSQMDLKIIQKMGWMLNYLKIKQPILRTNEALPVS